MSGVGAGRSFAIIGAAGYVAPRHMQAIKSIGGDLVAALDPADSVGVMDRYFPETRFFVEFERFDRHIDKMRRRGEPLDYLSICSPNYLHDAHVRFALRSGADAICEKPLVLNPWNLDGLEEIEQSAGRKVNAILQLRLHPAIVALKKMVREERSNHRYDVNLTYITSRGGWYHVSWKGDEKRSGGIATNIGVHFYDALSYVFGPLQESWVHHRSDDSAAGCLEHERARVRWFLSIDGRDLPKEVAGQQTTYRSMTVDGEEVEFSKGFDDLHTLSYQEIMKGEGFGLKDVRSSIETVSQIRTAELNPAKGERHPFLNGSSSGPLVELRRRLG